MDEKKTFNEGRQLYQTSLGHSDAPSTDYSNHNTEIWIHLQEASKDAESSCDFVCRASDILCHTCLVTLFLGLLLTLPIGMISIGVKYLTDCPVQPKIPVYLLVGGCFGLLKLIGMIWKSIQIRRYESMDLFYDANGADHAFASSTFKIMDTMLSLFLIGWHCVGSYWVFPIWQPYYEPLLHEPSNYCEKTVYLFASCQILGCSTLVCLVFLCLCGLGLCRAGTGMFQT
ncbi:transmembrane protein 272 isoform X2 [Patella vulgata]|uniref:transmembrane protein 272 isoform X2 n=1 Tax=Patella vulgata TaxID=6465 RepID=UPI00217FB0AF|nr:transmembrane protein 272 isoform X2 [Patella vulgata]